MVFWRLHGHASMGGAESMSERRPGVPRLRHGAGVGVGHVCAEGTVHGPIVSLQPLACSPDPKFWHKRTQKQAMVHCRLGIPERRVGDGRRCACYGYAAAARRRRSREYSFSCTPGWLPGVSRQLSSTDDCSCPRRSRLSQPCTRTSNPSRSFSSLQSTMTATPCTRTIAMELGGLAHILELLSPLSVTHGFHC